MDYSKACEDFNMASVKDPQFARATAYAAYCKAHLGKTGEAAALGEEADRRYRTRERDQPRSSTTSDTLTFKTGQYAKAVQPLNEALTLEPGLTAARFNRVKANWFS